MPNATTVLFALLSLPRSVGAHNCVPGDEQDLTAQRYGLTVDGVDPENIYVDHGLSGKNRTRPGLREAMAAVRSVDGMVAELEADLIRLRIREGMAVAKTKGRLRGKTPKLSASQRRHLLELKDKGEHTQAELAELSRSLERRSTVKYSDEQSRPCRRPSIIDLTAVR